MVEGTASSKESPDKKSDIAGKAMSASRSSTAPNESMPASNRGSCSLMPLPITECTANIMSDFRDAVVDAVARVGWS